MESTPKYFNNNRIIKGFTLVEILLVIGLFSVVVFASLPLIRGVVYQNDLDTTSMLIVSTLRQAENSSRNGLEDSMWGVKINYPNLILFKGSNYTNRDPARDVGYVLNSNLTLSGTSEIDYSKMYAIPYASDNTLITNGNIVITNLNNNSTTININAKGRLSY